MRAFVGCVYGFVLRLIAGGHIPVKPIFEARDIIVIIGGEDGREGGLVTGESAGCLDEMGFGFGHEPVRERGGNICVFLGRTVSMGDIFRRLHVENAALLASSIDKCTYAVHKVKYDPHGHAELLEVEITIIVDVCEIPDSGELILAQLAVLEDGSCLFSIKVSPTIG